ncbi:hypothetical protein BJ546DRAFT_245221 [Cryomyces antarcticus]
MNVNGMPSGRARRRRESRLTNHNHETLAIRGSDAGTLVPPQLTLFRAQSQSALPDVSSWARKYTVTIEGRSRQKYHDGRNDGLVAAEAPPCCVVGRTTPCIIFYIHRQVGWSKRVLKVKVAFQHCSGGEAYRKLPGSVVSSSTSAARGAIGVRRCRSL